MFNRSCSEFLASEGNENFWGFVNRVTDLNPELLKEGQSFAHCYLIDNPPKMAS